MALTELEQQVFDEIGRRGEELVELASALIRFDTEAREPEHPPREEAALQEYLAGRLAALGAEIDLWEPAREDVAGSRLVPDGGLGFAGRPQLAARFRGAGGGRSLLLNGHIDVVSPEPRESWTSDPNEPEVRDGKLYGRGSCDMKGGIAAMTFAAEVIAALGVRLAGDLLVCTVTDEESTGAGGLAAVAHGVRADAGIVTEPSGFDIWTSCRGSLIPTITVPGRPGHAGVGQPDWRQGGAVNAIEKATLIIDSLRRLQEEWSERPDHQHPHLSPGDIVPTVVSGGEWIVSYPASCRIAYHIAYLPAHADEDGWGGAIEQEIVERVQRTAAADPWLAGNPPVIEWATDVPSSEVPEDEPIVQTILKTGVDIGRPRRVSGMDSWHDGATFTRFGGTPCVCFGPRDLHVAHTIDEFVVVDDLVACAQELAVTAVRFCGLAS
ncbi:MAG: ArgE/DapE family deacylase [Actinobacteria bacterium]|nr:ArgE/DapE family deacylase [Actinomycetota bacterium]